MKVQKNKDAGAEPSFMDYRLAAINGEVYLNINSYTVIVSKLMIKSKDFGKNDELDATTANNSEETFNVKPLYRGEKLEITFLHHFNNIRCGGERGKIYALFTNPNVTHPDEPDSMYAEININPYHKEHDARYDNETQGQGKVCNDKSENTLR
eukprot:7310093-Ditylum_brightwellii.AAC.1